MGCSMGYDSREERIQKQQTSNISLNKGVLGEISKIEEEVQELKEAIRLQDDVNVLVELRDIIGACALFLKERYPKTDMLALVRSAIAMNTTKNVK